MTSGDNQYIMPGYAHATNTIVLRVQFKYTGAAYQLRAKSINDSAVEQSTTYVTISEAPHYLEVGGKPPARREPTTAF